VKRLSTWDTYVKEAMKDGDRSIELPLTEDESYVITYPTRAQGRKIADAQLRGNTDDLLIAMLGEAAGERVKELSENWPAFVLDAFLEDVMKKFGMLPEDEDDDDSEDKDNEEPAPAAKSTATSSTNGAGVNGRKAPGKAPAKRRTTTRATTSKR
jgi:hypothetical protein